MKIRTIAQPLRRLSLLVAVAGLVACTTNPYTGRHQLIMMSPSEEMKQGAQAYDQVLHDPNRSSECRRESLRPPRNPSTQTLPTPLRGK